MMPFKIGQIVYTRHLKTCVVTRIFGEALTLSLVDMPKKKRPLGWLHPVLILQRKRLVSLLDKETTSITAS